MKQEDTIYVAVKHLCNYRQSGQLLVADSFGLAFEK